MLFRSGLDICGEVYDGDAQDFSAQSRLNFENCFAFRDFRVSVNPMEYEFSNIDNQPFERGLTEQNDYFKLCQFSAKWDPVPCMLTQNHTQTVLVVKVDNCLSESLLSRLSYYSSLG